MSEIRDISLWPDGRLKIEWVRHHMPLLNGLEKEFSEEKPFKGLKIALSVHLEAKTGAIPCLPRTMSQRRSRMKA